MSVFRGIDSLWTGGKQISADQVPPAWLDLTGARFLGVPPMIIIAVGIMISAAVLLRRTATGREFFAIGSNPSGAELIGIPSKRLILLAFSIADHLPDLPERSGLRGTPLSMRASPMGMN